MSAPYRTRMDQLRDDVRRQGLDGAVISAPHHVRYMSGYGFATNQPLFLLIDQSSCVAILPASLIDSDSDAVDDVVPYTDYSIHEQIDVTSLAAQALRQGAKQLGLDSKRIGAELAHLSANEFRVLTEFADVTELAPGIEQMRRRKSEQEVNQIRRNVAVLESAFDTARQVIQPGVTELRLWAAMYDAMIHKVGHHIVLEGNLGSGPRSLEPDPQSSPRELQTGDLVLIDLYPIIDGYCADLTRTFVVGEPTDAQRAQHHVLEQALTNATAVLRPGVTGQELDAVVRSTIAAAGFGDYFPHHSGHAIGLEVQEPPFLIPADTEILEAGNVIAIEPGIYDPNVGGMRLEGNYLLLEAGYAALTDYPFELIACGS